MNFFFFLVGKK